MTFKPEYISDLREIHNQIKNHSIEGKTGALANFEEYLQKVIHIEGYSKVSWSFAWRIEVYSFGELFKTESPLKFLAKIQDVRKGLTQDQLEVLEFIQNEIEYNTQPTSDLLAKMQKLVARYPYNTEFKHNLGHLYKNNNELDKSLEQYEFVYTQEPNNRHFAKSLFTAQLQKIEDFIECDKYNLAEKYINDVFAKKTYKNESSFHNAMVSTSSRIKDHKLIQNKISSAEFKFQKQIDEELTKERRRLIEILGFFSAIMAFIFSTLSIGENFSFQEAIDFVISLGLVLILFLLVLDLVFRPGKIIWKDPKILITIFLGVLLIALSITRSL